ncbi:protein phosphatase 1 regulatory subunit 14B isoform X2 [Dermacentor variabilis]|uniref:protein phosphatase 1 regulatory subunit 14B isoform X2 n=1 Tax=Dermacentor variabilis TaxID=34621 RepID=UPI003F5BC466
MECGLAAGTGSLKGPGECLAACPKTLHVNFEGGDKEELQDRKKKYLTAKYGPHQMSLIKKRLRVEMWMYEQLQRLFACSDDNHDIEIDLDELLDMESDHRRRDFLRAKLVGAKQTRDQVEMTGGEIKLPAPFYNRVLARLTMLP